MVHKGIGSGAVVVCENMSRTLVFDSPLFQPKFTVVTSPFEPNLVVYSLLTLNIMATSSPYSLYILISPFKLWLQ